MRAFNELKVLALDFLKDMDQVTCKMISIELGVDVANAQMLMLRLRRQKLVEWDYIPKVGRGRREYVYTINDRGLGRLEYLKARMKKAS